MGRVGDLDSGADAFDSMEPYSQMRFPRCVWHHVFAGYNPQHSTLDGQWYATDLYVQPPALRFSEVYLWSIMLDCNDPSEWWYHRIAYTVGIRIFPHTARTAARI